MLNLLASINVISGLETAVVFLLMISILVAAHELGHYLFARFFNMGVEEFSIGMGKRLWLWGKRTYDIPVDREYVHTVEEDGSASSHLPDKFAASMLEGGGRARESEVVDTPTGRVLRETTEFSVRAIPIGGFVRIKGMVPEEDGSEVNIPGGFYQSAPWKRFIVLAAGPAFSVLAGMIILTSVNFVDGKSEVNPAPIIGRVNEKSVAGQAGLRKGDVMVAINGKTLPTFFNFVQAIRDAGGAQFTLDYTRDGKPLKTTLTPERDKEETDVLDAKLEPTGNKAIQYKVGIAPAFHRVPVTLVGAVAEAAIVPKETVIGLFNLIKKPSTAKDQVGGPGMIVMATDEAVKSGIESVLILSGLLSISVGIFNLLPIPLLDGGGMVMSVIEMLRGGKRPSANLQAAISMVGLAMVLLLMCSTLFLDFQRLGNQSQKPAVAKPAK